MGQLRLVISAAAGRDLDAIYDYTADHWGIEQADRYVGSFDAIYGKLLLYPDLGNAPEQGGTYRRLRHESHLIFYRLAEDSLRIKRILHIAWMPSATCVETSTSAVRRPR